MASTMVNTITQDIIHFLFGKRVGLSLAWILTSRLGWLATEPQVSTSLTLHGPGLQMCPFKSAFLCVL